MSIYAVGDIQGCYTTLRRLLDSVNFDPGSDTLWAAGDLINRGPESLETLKYLQSLKNSCICVLGNHDLHLIAVAVGVRTPRPNDTLEKLLASTEIEQHIDWLRFRPIVHYDDTLKTLMVHAGVPPIWDLDKVLAMSNELQNILKDDDYAKLLPLLFDKSTKQWSNSLNRSERIGLITNYFTQMRYCKLNGHLKLNYKKILKKPDQYSGYLPWFRHPSKLSKNIHVVFGHWASLNGITNTPKYHALDTGCAWDRQLTLINLSTWKRNSVDNLA